MMRKETIPGEIVPDDEKHDTVEDIDDRMKNVLASDTMRILHFNGN